MAELLSTLIPLLSFLGGGAVALIGAWVGPATQRKIAGEEAKRESERLLLVKAEEIFLEIDQVRSMARKAVYASKAIYRLRETLRIIRSEISGA